MATDRGIPLNLTVPPESFSANRLANQARKFGYAQPHTLEALIWDYELYAQIQQRAPESCRLKGGAAVQLYVPAERQRASIDVDVLTTLPQREMQQLLEDISTAYGLESPYLQFEPFVPDRPAAIEGLYSFTTFVPSSVGQKWKLADDTVIEARVMKLDFHHIPILPDGERRDGVAVGIPLGYQPLCVRRGYLIAEKLLTQARGTVGVPNDRYQDLPKHLYDLDSLLLSEDAVQPLEEAANSLPALIGAQGNQWQDSEGVRTVLQDLESSLGNFAIIDYSDERGQYETAVRRLETLYLPGGARMRLHLWATMASRALAIVKMLLAAIGGDERIIRSFYPEAVLLARKIRLHAQPGKLTKIFHGRLPKTLRRIRQLRGSPPERLYWLLVTRENLGELEEIVSGNCK